MASCNVGTEELKGNEKSQETSELLKNSSLNYIGFVEGDDIYKGNVWCDSLRWLWG